MGNTHKRKSLANFDIDNERVEQRYIYIGDVKKTSNGLKIVNDNDLSMNSYTLLFTNNKYAEIKSTLKKNLMIYAEIHSYGFFKYDIYRILPLPIHNINLICGGLMSGWIRSYYRILPFKNCLSIEKTPEHKACDNLKLFIHKRFYKIMSRGNRYNVKYVRDFTDQEHLYRVIDFDLIN